VHPAMMPDGPLVHPDPPIRSSRFNSVNYHQMTWEQFAEITEKHGVPKQQ
jgi:hypothetical protein